VRRPRLFLRGRKQAVCRVNALPPTLLSSNKDIFSLGLATFLSQSTLKQWRLEGFANKTLNLDTITFAAAL
jgi:hypothetical protein